MKPKPGLYNFADVIDFQEGPGILAKDFRDTGVPLIRLAGLDQGVSLLNGCNYLEPELVSRKYNHFKIKKGDVLLSSSASLGRTAVVDNRAEGAIIYTGLIRMRPKNNEIIAPFIKILMESKYFNEQIESMGVGSVIRHFGPSHLRQIKIPLPSINIQEEICKIIYTLDNKVQLNRDMNQTLEQMAQAIFKHWFIDFEFPNENGKPYRSSGGKMVDSEMGKIPEGSKAGKLSDIMENIKHPLNAGEKISDRQYVPIECLSMKKLSIENTLPYTQAQSSLIGFEKGDILLGAMRVYFHRVNIAQFSGVTRTTTFVLRPKEESLLAYSLLLINQDETIKYANSHSKGSTMPYAVWNNSLDSLSVLIPNDKIIKKFNERIMPMLKKLENNRIENQTLSRLRDSLLPRLMSGKILRRV